MKAVDTSEWSSLGQRMMAHGSATTGNIASKEVSR